VALHSSHCFIPTVSALALETDDPFFDVAGAPDLPGMTPFDAVYFPTENQEHVLITPENAAWVRNEIHQGTLSTPAPAAASLVLAGSPNPFAGSLRLSFALDRAGPVDLRIFGVDGREVARLLQENRGPGAHDVSWDGRDGGGKRVPAGVYFVRLEGSGRVTNQRVVKVE
jgi:hypothetical protein